MEKLASETVPETDATDRVALGKGWLAIPLAEKGVTEASRIS